MPNAYAYSVRVLYISTMEQFHIQILYIELIVRETAQQYTEISIDTFVRKFRAKKNEK